MDLGVELEEQLARVREEPVQEEHEEEVRREHLLALLERDLRALEVEPDVQALEEIRHRVAVAVGPLGRDAHLAQRRGRLVLGRALRARRGAPALGGAPALLAQHAAHVAQGGLLVLDHARGGHVPQQVRARRLQRAQHRLLHKELDDVAAVVAAVDLVVEEHEQRPVQQPRALLELREGRARRTRTR